MTRFALLGPTYPFRGGIAHYTTLLSNHLRSEHETLLISFTRQYPQWLFPGRSDRDPSQFPLKSNAEYLLDPVNPFTWRKTVKRLESWKPDAVVIPWWVPFWAPAWAAVGRAVKRLPNDPKLIFICHNVLPHESSQIDKAALRLALSPADGYIVHSKRDAVRLDQEFPGRSIKVAVHPTYSAIGRGQVSAPDYIPNFRPLLLFTGFVRRYKGLDILIDALALLKNQVHLLVAGEFWENERIYHDQISKLHLEEAVTIINRYVPDEELAAIITAADVIVLPYRDATQSGVIQIAYGYSKPVITTNVGGLADVVADGRTGLIVPPENPQALANAIDHFISEDLGQDLSDNIAAEASRFSWEKIIDSLMDLSVSA